MEDEASLSFHSSGNFGSVGKICSCAVGRAGLWDLMWFEAPVSFVLSFHPKPRVLFAGFGFLWKAPSARWALACAGCVWGIFKIPGNNSVSQWPDPVGAIPACWAHQSLFFLHFGPCCALQVCVCPSQMCSLCWSLSILHPPPGSGSSTEVKYFRGSSSPGVFLASCDVTLEFFLEERQTNIAFVALGKCRRKWLKCSVKPLRLESEFKMPRF